MNFFSLITPINTVTVNEEKWVTIGLPVSKTESGDLVYLACKASDAMPAQTYMICVPKELGVNNETSN